MVLGVRFYAFNFTRSYPAAQIFCENLNVSNLASFVSEDDINSMVKVMPDPKLRYWTGLKYTHLNDSWSFIDGTDTAFALSKILMNATYHSDMCVLISGDGIYPTHCTEVRLFICQTGQDPAFTVPLSSAG